MGATSARRVTRNARAARSRICVATAGRRYARWVPPPASHARRARPNRREHAASPRRPDSMPFFHDQDRSSLRRMYVDAWRKHREQRVLEPLEAQIVALVGEHPEYHALLADDAALMQDWT